MPTLNLINDYVKWFLTDYGTQYSPTAWHFFRYAKRKGLRYAGNRTPKNLTPTTLVRLFRGDCMRLDKKPNYVNAVIWFTEGAEGMQ